MAQRKNMAIVGLGNMGGGMAHRLLAEGYRLTVYNRTSAKAAELVAAGATLAATPAEAVTGQSTVLLSLSDDSAVEEVLFGQLVPALAPGTTVIDTSTVAPDYARTVPVRLTPTGVRRVEAVVIGNPVQARAGELRVFTAGPAVEADAVADVLACIGSEVRHVGEAGAATVIKLVFNMVLGAQVAALAEAVELGTAAGLDRDLLLSAISGSGFSSAVMRFRTELMLARRYRPAFFRTELMAKDLRLALDGAAEGAAELPLLETVWNRFAGLVAAGMGDQDASVLVDHVATVPAGGVR